MTFPSVPGLRFERRGFALFATLDRPEAKNALSAAMVEGLFALCDELDRTPDIRALVLRGAGGTFCAGGDIKDFAAQLAALEPAPGAPDPVAEGNRRFGALLLRLDALPQTVIAVVEGAAFGGAMGLVAVSDIAIAEEQAKFSLSETTLGLPPAQIAPFVARRIGLFNARRLALTGERFGAETALGVGLVSSVASKERLDALVEETLNRIGRCEPAANAVTKRLLNRAAGGVDPALLDAAAQDFARCLRSKGRDGAAAFAAKRPPEWVETYKERGDG